MYFLNSVFVVLDCVNIVITVTIRPFEQPVKAILYKKSWSCYLALIYCSCAPVFFSVFEQMHHE